MDNDLSLNFHLFVTRALLVDAPFGVAYEILSSLIAALQETLRRKEPDKAGRSGDNSSGHQSAPKRSRVVFAFALNHFIQGFAFEIGIELQLTL